MINNDKSRWLAWASVVLVAIGLLVAYYLEGSSEIHLQSQVPAVSIASLSDTTPQPSAIPTIDFIAFQETVVVVMQTMPTYTPIPHVPAVDEKVLGGQRRELMEAAQKTVVVMAHITPILARQPTPVPPLTPYPGPPTQTAGAGTIVWTNACTLGQIIAAQNEWYAYEGSHVIAVCAGTRYTGEAQGQISIDTYDPDTHNTLSGPDIYTVPTTVQWVKVIDAVGERLTLQADTGALFYFDIPTRQWVNP